MLAVGEAAYGCNGDAGPPGGDGGVDAEDDADEGAEERTVVRPHGLLGARPAGRPSGVS